MPLDGLKGKFETGGDIAREAVAGCDTDTLGLRFREGLWFGGVVSQLGGGGLEAKSTLAGLSFFGLESSLAIKPLRPAGPAVAGGERAEDDGDCALPRSVELAPAGTVMMPGRSFCGSYVAV